MLAVSRGMTSSTGDYGASWKTSGERRTAPATSHVVPMQFLVTTTTTKTQQDPTDVHSVREASFNKEEV